MGGREGGRGCEWIDGILPSLMNAEVKLGRRANKRGGEGMLTHSTCCVQVVFRALIGTISSCPDLPPTERGWEVWAAAAAQMHVAREVTAGRDAPLSSYPSPSQEQGRQRSLTRSKLASRCRQCQNGRQDLMC